MNYFTSDISSLFKFSTGSLTLSTMLICTAVSLLIGAVIAYVFGRGEKTSKGFAMTLTLLPAIVQMVIMLVNGDVGTGVAVMGAFGLVRFRSAPGSAKEICAIFLAMAAGLATATQHLLAAIIFTAVICAVSMALTALGGKASEEKTLKITIPESLDYSGAFSDIFEKYTASNSLDEVKTSNMGSLYKLSYTITLKDPSQEKQMIDELRERNGNLEIACGRPVTNSDRL
ncbi:protein of unknown function [Ruminococcus sp. YE71]|uniref:DUF4956 domain-containing protein n=1 Tax=unclassified Ruminococcus TaxID=2608920 RepID=UPI0008826F10|nr:MULTISPECIES: DUF4956 domain-containing protein [unclassified Ruminococcus]SDA13900.1 protein of unknown function [Ruminococcus sp. YE78]SFW20075.1 protein of unknown function [Ruminococcus sp. YE71]